MKRRTVLSTMAIMVFGVVIIGGNVAGQQKSGTAKEQFSGTWKLLSWKIEQANGELIDTAMGPNPSGLIMYHPDGHMCAAIMRSDRPQFISSDALGGAPKEIKAAFEGYLSYCGSYQVNEQEHFVIHSIQVSWFPNWLGTEQKRFFQLDGDRLTLKTPPLIGFGKPQIHRLIWERLR